MPGDRYSQAVSNESATRLSPSTGKSVGLLSATWILCSHRAADHDFAVNGCVVEPPFLCYVVFDLSKYVCAVEARTTSVWLTVGRKGDLASLLFP